MLPNQLRLFGEELVLKYPNDPALISDVINVLSPGAADRRCVSPTTDPS
jgi:hypothetical protein